MLQPRQGQAAAQGAVNSYAAGGRKPILTHRLEAQMCPTTNNVISFGFSSAVKLYVLRTRQMLMRYTEMKNPDVRYIGCLLIKVLGMPTFLKHLYLEQFHHYLKIFNSRVDFFAGSVNIV